MNEFDTEHIAEIIYDDGTRFNWMNAYVIRFLNTAISKGAEELPSLYRIYPEQIIALFRYWGWSDEEINKRIEYWRNERFWRE